MSVSRWSLLRRIVFAYSRCSGDRPPSASKAGVADDRGERRADLVAQHRQELALHLRLGLRLVERRLEQAPRRQAHHADPGDEERVDQRPLPRLREGGGVVEHRVPGRGSPRRRGGGRRKPIAMSERNPILVQRDERHHHEEVEMHLDRAVREMDENGGRREQPDRGGDHARAAREHGGRREAGEGGDPGRLEQDVAEPVAADHPEDRDSDDVHPEDDEDPAVTVPPGRLRERPAARERTRKPPDRGRHATMQPRPVLRRLCAYDLQPQTQSFPPRRARLTAGLACESADRRPDQPDELSSAPEPR